MQNEIMCKGLYMLMTKPVLNKNMLIDEQVTMFLHIISHHLKNRVIKHHFNRFGETITRSFHNVLNTVIRLQDVLFKKADPITTNSTEPRWKWLKVLECFR
ncbi:hypothetical protein Gotur_011017 [Gossypium turneri]